MSRESEALRARVRQIRQVLAPPAGRMTGRGMSPGAPDPTLLHDLQGRVAHLEQMLQGLQDSIYRESQRQDKRLTELERRTDPAALASALSKNARDRGL